MGVKAAPTQANFVMLDTGRPATAVYREMMRRGVIVRPLHGFGLPTHIRVTIGTARQNMMMLSALRGALDALDGEGKVPSGP